GPLHMGHFRNYVIGDAFARYKLMRGFNVLNPFGWDAFGLPAENAAIKSGIPPRVSIEGNIAISKQQLDLMGVMYAWDREVATCMEVAPEDEQVQRIVSPDQRAAVDAYIERTKADTQIERLSAEHEKTGVFSGAYAINPFTDERIPIWIADYVLATYGTGAI